MVNKKPKPEPETQDIMIQKLEAKNLNRRSFDYALAPLTIITGDNAAGKSTIADAIKLATLGSVPGFPATNAGIMENFASGPSLTVAIKTARGSFIRSWTRSGKSVKSATDGDEQIAKDLAPALISGEAFLAAKPAARAIMLRTAFAIKGDPKEVVLAAIAGKIQPSKSIVGLPFDEFVAKFLEELAESATGHRANVKRMAGVIQGLTQLDAEVAAPTVSKADLDAAREAVTKAAQALGAAEQASRAVRKVEECQKPEKTRADLKAELETLEASRREKDATIRSGSDLYNAALSAFRKAMREYDAALSAHAEAASSFDRALEAAAALDITPEVTDSIIASTEGLANRIDEIRRKACVTSLLQTAAMSKLDVAQAELDTLSAAAAGDCECKTCGAAKEFWKAEILKLASERVEAASRKRDELLESRTKAVKIASEAQSELEAAEIQIARRVAALELSKAIEGVKANPSPSGIPAEPAAYDAEAAQAELYNLECEIQETKDDLEAWDQYEAYLSYVSASEVTAKALEEATAAHAAAMQKANELQAAFDAGSAAAESEAKKKQANDEHDKAKKDLAEVEETADIVKETAAKEAEKTLAPLLAIVNTFTKGILSPGLSNVGLDIGRWHGAQWQPIARLSGAEKSIVVAALSVALATAGSKLVLIDEFSVIDDKWKPMFLANLREAYVSGQIEQAIILDNRETTADGWETMKLSKPE